MENPVDECSFRVSLVQSSQDLAFGLGQILREVLIEPNLNSALWREPNHVVIDVDAAVMLINDLISNQRLMEDIQSFAGWQVADLREPHGYPFGFDTESLHALADMPSDLSLYLIDLNQVVILCAPVLVSGQVVEHRDAAVLGHRV